MRKNSATKTDVKSMAKTLEALMGEEEVESVARDTGFLRRKRVLVPYALVLSLLSTLGVGNANWIADILRISQALSRRYSLYPVAGLSEPLRMLSISL